MKIAILIASLCLASTTAFAQGKVTFGNDSNHLLLFDNNPWFLTSPSGHGFGAFAGQPVPQLGSANDLMQYFTAELWAGTSLQNMSLATSVPAGKAGFADGRLANVPVTLTGIPAGTPAFFRVQIFETAGKDMISAASHGYLFGESPTFQVTPGSIIPNPITSTTFGNWPNGPIVLIDFVPEPSSLSLLSFGVLTLMLFRRSK